MLHTLPMRNMPLTSSKHLPSHIIHLAPFPIIHSRIPAIRQPHSNNSRKHQPDIPLKLINAPNSPILDPLPDLLQIHRFLNDLVIVRRLGLLHWVLEHRAILVLCDRVQQRQNELGRLFLWRSGSCRCRRRCLVRRLGGPRRGYLSATLV